MKKILMYFKEKIKKEWLAMLLGLVAYLLIGFCMYFYENFISCSKSAPLELYIFTALTAYMITWLPPLLFG